MLPVVAEEKGGPLTMCCLSSCQSCLGLAVDRSERSTPTNPAHFNVHLASGKQTPRKLPAPHVLVLQLHQKAPNTTMFRGDVLHGRFYGSLIMTLLLAKTGDLHLRLRCLVITSALFGSLNRNRPTTVQKNTGRWTPRRGASASGDDGIESVSSAGGFGFQMSWK